MEHHKQLYKENSHFLSPLQYKSTNRETLQVNRAKKRSDLFFNSRHISLSPADVPGQRISATSTPAPNSKVPKTLLSTKTPCNAGSGGNKENFVDEIRDEASANGKENMPGPSLADAGASTGNIVANINRKAVEKHISRMSLGIKKDEKMCRQELYLKRYVEWKQRKKLEEMRKNNSKPLNGNKQKINDDDPLNKGNEENADIQLSVAKSLKDLIPKNHQFKPPEGLKDPRKQRPVILAQKNQRRSLYTVVSTPPKRHLPNSLEKKKPIISSLAQRVFLNDCKLTKVRELSKERTTPAPPPAAPPTADVPTAPASKTQVNRRAVSKERVETKTPGGVSVGNHVGTSLKRNEKRVHTRTKSVVTNTLNKNPANNHPLSSIQGKSLFAPSAPEDLASHTASKKTLVPTSIPATKPSIDLQKPISSKKHDLKANKSKLANKTNSKSGVVTGDSGGSGCGGAIAKAQKLLQEKKELALPLATKSKPNKLSTRMKAKTNPNCKINLNDKRQLIEAQVEDILAVQTPTFLIGDNPFEPLVTSTKQKSPAKNFNKETSNDPNDAEITASLDSNMKKEINISNKSSARKAILQNVAKPRKNKQQKDLQKTETKDKQVKSSLRNTKNSKKESTSVSNKVTEERQPSSISDNYKFKYNFIENFDISCGDFLGDEEVKEEPQSPKEKHVDQSIPSANEVEPEAIKELNQTAKSSDAPHTPENQERPSNYLSPYVTVSRGKVSLKAEKEKRDSVYLQNDSPQTPIAEDSKQINNESATNQTPIEIKRALEAVLYFRKQLADEIDRLHSLCDKWQTYKDENVEKLQENGGDDMIDVTIGQTRLLTSKKLMQFKGLIDRCEAGATGINCVPDDGSEDTKPITPIDLEGFWSMVGLQVENVDKRFENLEKWKANAWIDPQEIKPTKTKKNLTKVIKKTKTTNTKAKPNSGLVQFLQKLHKENKSKKNKDINENAIDIICNNDMVRSSFTPIRSRRSSRLFISEKETPTHTRRVSIIVKDRKSFSNSPTIITIHSPLRRRSSTKTRKCLQNSSPQTSSDSFNKLEKNSWKDSEAHDLLKVALLGATEEKSLFKSSLNTKNVGSHSSKTTTDESSSPPRLAPRKSILKTPGTAKDKSKNVIFNNKLQIRKFNFLVNEPTSDDEEDADDDGTHKNLLNSETGLEAAGQYEKDKQEEDGLSDGTPRVYRLRHRKVYLRPSCEIVIPK